MKTQKKFARKINAITPGRWTAYAAAGAASALTCANSAEAEIHYSGNVSIELTLNAQATLPLSNGASLVFRNTYRSTFLQNFNLLLKAVSSGSARGYLRVRDAPFYPICLCERTSLRAGFCLSPETLFMAS